MHVIRHDYPRIKFNMWMMAWYLRPSDVSEFPNIGQIHLEVLNEAEIPFTFM